MHSPGRGTNCFSNLMKSRDLGARSLALWDLVWPPWTSVFLFCLSHWIFKNKTIYVQLTHNISFGYHIMIRYLYIFQNVRLINITIHRYKIFLLLTTLKIYFLSNFQIHNMVLLTIVVMLYLTAPWLLIF